MALLMVKLAVQDIKGHCELPESYAAWSCIAMGAFSFSKRTNSRIHAGWSGQARAETITPSRTASEFTNCAPAALMSGSKAGYAAVRIPLSTPAAISTSGA